MMLLKGHYKKIEPASGAIIMACGIYLIGAVEAFPVLDVSYGKYLAFFLLVAWVIIYKDLSIQFFHRDFLIPFLQNPVNSFVIGTWIAGVSVLCNVFLKYFPEILLLTQAMAVFNTFLWFFFLANCFYNFKQLLFDHRNFPVHGAVLLSTVGTQSIIILLNNVFFQFPVYFSEAIIILGILFYLAGIALLFNRYIRHHNWTLADDWANTNCIIHGALSITGLAIVTTNTFTPMFATYFWLLVFGLLIIVEAVELVRAIKRIKQYGWEQGIFTYHVTQWSRNFTFGMFYTFTLIMQANPFYPVAEPLNNLQRTFLDYWAWVVLIAIIWEIAIFMKARVTALYQEKLIIHHTAQ
ncbi:hypothetical protein SAMN04488072_10221 [Lentibacillus halodurans]|uniref:Voltage-dependent anion channel n=1 Tax=Lentibacillus halodurans TaxID=237679 RepID=A0A1I0VYG8_9BACI|nr:hypothetical protein [Lentibacillus halodurans]SFA80726.1 hypothetical protein SAMN04488072_10221 [Lentibacillus halodurans]